MSKGISGLGFLFGAVIGAGIGAVAGILMAPRSGEETRAMAADSVNQAAGAVQETLDSVAPEAAEKAAPAEKPATDVHVEAPTEAWRPDGRSPRVAGLS